MQRHLLVRGKRRVHRKPGELVAEGHSFGMRGEHARGEALLHAAHAARTQALEQPELRGRGNDRGCLDKTPSGRAQPCDAREHRVLHRRRHGLCSARQNLGHEERIARCLAIQLGRVHTKWLGQMRNRVFRKRRQPDPADRPRRRQVTEHCSQGVLAVQLIVAERPDDEHADRLDAAGEDAQHVERCRVGPVQVLDHDHKRRAFSQVAHQRRGKLVRFCAFSCQGLQLATGDLGHVQERSQRPRRRKRVARSQEHLRGRGECGSKAPDQHGLADPRLSRHEDEPSTTLGGDGLESRPQGGKLARPLEEVGFVCECGAIRHLDLSAPSWQPAGSGAMGRPIGSAALRSGSS